MLECAMVEHASISSHMVTYGGRVCSHTLTYASLCSHVLAHTGWGLQSGGLQAGGGLHWRPTGWGPTGLGNRFGICQTTYLQAGAYSACGCLWVSPGCLLGVSWVPPGCSWMRLNASACFLDASWCLLAASCVTPDTSR